VHFAIRYLTQYRYDGPVTDNLNALRVKPATTQHQRVDDFGVRVEPETRLHQHLDYYGTTVIEFGVSRAHEALAVDVRARVATTAPGEPPEASWEQLERPAYRAAGVEFLLPWSDEPDDIRVDELVGLTRAETPLATLRRLVEIVPDRFEYKSGVTYVGSTVQDLLRGGAGVCQDFAHLALLMLRRNGIAARYASGYLFAPREDGGGTDAEADSAEVDTHAWVEALLPAEDGEARWVGVDPTNRCLTGDRHVKIGHGRFYADVPPIKGVYRGAPTAGLDVTVKMHRIDASGTA
jgi:transglutaminase-like putative cysteine protease